MPAYEFTYPSVATSEEKMLDDVKMVLQENGVDEYLQDSFMLVVSEAFTNALVHGNEQNPQKTIKLVLNVNKEVLSADIVDRGRGGLGKVKHRHPPTMFSEGGRGVDLMRYFASTVRFTETQYGGLKVSICFDLTKKNKEERLT